jgi:hypothetical protein
VVGTDRETTKLQNPKNIVEKTLVGAEDKQFFTLGDRDHSHLFSHSFPPGSDVLREKLSLAVREGCENTSEVCGNAHATTSCSLSLITELGRTL